MTKNAKATGDQFYYVEYTSVTDAKGKPDWNAAKVVNNSADPTSIPPTGAAGDYTISKLNPGTQYFVRVVTTDKAYASGTAWSAMTKSVASKEVKIKTLAVPMATIQKPGFAMGGTNGTDFGFKFGVLTPNAAVKAGKLDLLNANDTFTYKLFVADASAKADKATGKLGGAVEIPESAFDDILANSTPDPKGKFQPTPTGVITFEALETALNDVGMSVANMKTLQFQLEVTYKAGTSKAGFNATDTYCTNYTKAAKLTMPKWFV